MGKELASKKRPSRLWYLLPIFLGLIGGVIGYFLLKDRDRKFAERLLIIGLVMIVVWIVLWAGLSFLFSFLAYSYISGVFTAETAYLIEVINASCAGGIHSIIIRNVGTYSIDTFTDLQVTVDGNPATCVGTRKIQPGSSVTCEISTSTSSGLHSINIVGPSNTVSISNFCP